MVVFLLSFYPLLPEDKRHSTQSYRPFICMNNFISNLFFTTSDHISTSTNKAYTLCDAHKQTFFFYTSGSLLLRRPTKSRKNVRARHREHAPLPSRRVDIVPSLIPRRKQRLITVCLVNFHLTNTGNEDLTYIMSWICVVQLCWWRTVVHWGRAFTFHRKRIFSFRRKNPLRRTDRTTSISVKKELHIMNWDTLSQTWLVLRCSCTDRSSISGLSWFKGWILGFHSRDETAMLVYKTMAKCRSSFA